MLESSLHPARGLHACQPTGTIAVGDSFKVPADKTLTVNVTSNDFAATGASWSLTQPLPTFVTPTSTTPTALLTNGIALSSAGVLTFTPAKSSNGGGLKSGAVVTGVYVINLPGSGYRSPPVSFTINVTDSTGPFPPSPPPFPPPLGTGEECGARSRHARACAGRSLGRRPNGQTAQEPRWWPARWEGVRTKPPSQKCGGEMIAPCLHQSPLS